MITPLTAHIIVAEKNKLPAWEHEMLTQLFNEGFIKDITFITTPAKKIKQEFFAYRVFKKLENQWFRSLPDAFKEINLEEKYPDAIFTSLTDTASLPEADFVYISCLADNNYTIASIPQYGIWSMVFGSGKYKDAEPPAFGEVMNDETVIGSSLWVQLPGNSKMINVYEGNTLTVPYSVKNSLNCLAWKSASFFGYRLKEFLLAGNEVFLNKYNRIEKIDATIASIQKKAPGNFQLLFLFARNIFRYLGYKLRKKNNGRFSLLYSNETFNGGALNLASFKPVTMPKGVFHADPFIITKDGINYIFFEEYMYLTNKAHISVMKIDDRGNCSTPVIVLDKPYHLSYPFVFKWEGEYFMIPETSANKTVELYKAASFPYQWELVMNLMENIVLLDATLIYENNTWWMFGSTSNTPFASTNDQLVLYYSNNLFSTNWTPHPQNPVATDIANCRPAGKIFRINNELFRPAQNNASRQYGYALTFNKINRLTETDYYEEKVSEIIPGKDNNLTAVHTFNFSDGLVLIDGIIKK